MKRLLTVIFAVSLLCGCGTQTTFETIGNMFDSQQQPEAKRISVLLPSEAAATVMAGDDGRLYFCDGYEMMTMTLPAGDVGRTLKEVTGYESGALTVLETSVSSLRRYECAWTCASEGGDQVGRAVVLDDGDYHYVVTVLAPAQEAGSLQQVWEELFASVALQS